MAKIDPEEPCPCASGRLFKECHGPKVIIPRQPDIVEKIALSVVPEPDPNAAAVMQKIGEGTIIFRGTACGLAMICGTCENHLTEGVPRQNIKGIILKCNACGTFNAT